ncbi:integrase core domain-containing protein [Brucella sp. TWI432]
MCQLLRLTTELTRPDPAGELVSMSLCQTGIIFLERLHRRENGGQMAVNGQVGRFAVRRWRDDHLLNETLFSSLPHARSALLHWPSDYNDHRSHSGLGWMTPAEFAQTINPRRGAVLRSRNGSAPQPAATAPNTATQNRWSELKTG